LNTSEETKAVLDGHYKGIDTALEPIANTLVLVRAIAQAITETKLPSAVSSLSIVRAVCRKNYRIKGMGQVIRGE